MYVRVVSLAGVLLGLLPAPGARAAIAVEPSPWITALSASYVVVDMSSGDLDGDGQDETVICYREDVGRTEQKGGIAILAGSGPGQRPVFHVQLEVMCEKARINGRRLGILLDGKKQLVWTYGDELKFRGDRGSFMSQVVVRASSATDWQHKAERAFDGDLSTSWAEGTAGTGLGQTLTLKLPRAINIGAIGIFGGSGGGTRAYFDHNRIHRASLEAKTEADVGDATAGVDFASLGIDSIGDRLEFSSENKPQVTYVGIDKQGVVQLELRIESVYLGDRKDDTHIAEIEIVPLLPLSETLDKATPAGSSAVSALTAGSSLQGAPGEGSPNTDLSLATEGATRSLDESGRSLVEDDL